MSGTSCSGDAMDEDPPEPAVALDEAAAAAAAAAPVPAVDRLGRELQKWIECSKCHKWRKVPYSVDTDRFDDWGCSDNIWDAAYASCSVPQQLENDEIDAILQLQSEQLEAAEAAAAAAAAAAAVAAAGEAAMQQMHHQEYAATYDDPSTYDDEDYEDNSRRGKKANGRWGRGRGRGRGRGAPGKGRGRGRGGGDSDSGFPRGVPGRPRVGGRMAQDEAAEALLGMGFAYEDDGEEPGVPRERFPPGKVVWAKVEGHDWWPAKVVRRRAVPREVGLPPGGPEAVRFQIPVVFFTPKGIPGEAPKGMDASQAALHALKLAAEGPSTEDDAEYAWLSQEALKPFMPGDTSGSGDGPPEDETLRECIAAADLAVSAEDAGLDALAEAESDSDGGWGPQAQPSSGSFRGRRGGRGGRRGKGRGGRRGRGRGRWGRYDDEEGSDEDYEPGGGGPAAGGVADQYAAGGQRIVVEAILGWRWPGGVEPPPVAGEGASAPAGQDVAMAEAGAEAQEAAAPAATPEDEGPAVARSYDDAEPPADDPEPKAGGMEADAVAALLAAADEGPPTQSERWASQNILCVLEHISCACVASYLSFISAGCREPEFLVKYVGRSHIHNEWVPESTLMQIAKRKVLNFKKRHNCGPGDPPVNLADPKWSEAERFIARRSAPHNPGWEILVKWQGLGYEHATWEAETDPALAKSECMALLRALWERQVAAIRRASPQVLEEAQAARIAARGNLPQIESTPDYVARGGEFRPHQCEAINWLRKEWSEGNNAVLADEGGLGKSATVLAFLQSLRGDFGCPGPVLIVAPAAALAFWAGECARWLGPDVDVVSYHGNVGARTILHDNELWLQPGSLDGRGVQRAVLPDRVPKPDVVVTSHEVFAADASELRAFRWEVVALDERNRTRTSLTKAHNAMADIAAR